MIKKCLTAMGIILAAGSVMANIKTGYGYVEQILLLPSQTILEAKLDTGAGISSISVTNIYIYDKDGQNYIRFDVMHEMIKDDEKTDKSRKKSYDLPLKRDMKIKNRLSENIEERYDERPVVDMPICFDGKIYNIEMNLTDRSRFKYPVLLGRKALIKLNAVVDPGQKFTINLDDCIKLLEKENEKIKQKSKDASTNKVQKIETTIDSEKLKEEETN
ncbi:ATP-dependent zinc protease [Fastidiosibacter lacustris]|uniref:ATP-dependent zinc protease family protein n=1 Tax=Fastidiosibacter lacustris TaxID=2056695 RepID=UPI000E348C97|nr:RimK/LysX family protein [Fastidiosibacter lacustris]